MRSRKPSGEDPQEFLDHVFRGTDNEAVQVFRGTEADVRDMVADARRWRKDFAYRHFIVAPREMPGRGMFADAVEELAREFGFPAEGAVVVGHRKPRHGLDGAPVHIHVLVREVDPLTGKVLDSSWDYARHEKVCRKLEARWGHALVPGRFNKEVMAALKAEGCSEADILDVQGLGQMARAEGRYRKGLDKEVQRKAGRRMPDVARAVEDAHGLSAGDAAAFLRLLDEQELRVVPGDKEGRWVIQARGGDGGWHFAGALHRLARMQSRAAHEWMIGPRGPGEDGNDQDRAGLEADRLRGGPGGDEGRGGPARRGRERDADGLRGGAGQRDDGWPDHRVGGHGARGRRGVGGRRAAGAHARGGVPAAGAGGAAEGAPAAALLARAEGRSHAAARPGGRGGAGGRPGVERPLPGPTPALARALDGLLAEAALQRACGGDELEPIRAARMSLRPPLARLLEGRNRTISVAEPERDRKRRRAAFHALLLRNAYSLRGWLPLEALLHLERVEFDRERGHVLIVLTNGARIMDSGDRITMRGEVEDVSVAEMAECAVRKGWTEVEVWGDPEFRMAVSRELLLRGIEVRDCPLSPDEQAALRRKVAVPAGERLGGFDRGLVGMANDSGHMMAVEDDDVPSAPRPSWAG